MILPAILLAAVALAIAHSVAYHQPRQPIAFSHALHAGDKRISCAFCHTGVKHGNNAGVPSVQDCMQCHQVVAPDKPEIRKLHEEYWKKERPIEWFKVYNMPETVRFSHKAHVKAGVACATCHGDMTKAGPNFKAARNFVMGECVSCHRQNKAPTDCTTCHK